MRPRQFDAARCVTYAAAGLVLLAIALGRMHPRESPRRVPAAPQAGLGDLIAGIRATRIDLETGRLVGLDLPAGERVDLASGSPWADEGGSQVVGRWSRRDAYDLPSGQGLVRLGLPGGRLLDRVETEILPVSPPCWYPGMTARILYAACDGALYHFAFAEGDAPGDKAPRPVTWRALPAGLAAVRVLDPAWSGSGGVLLATVFARPIGAAVRTQSPALWWLRLDPSGSEVVAAGRVVRREGSAGADAWERLPAVGKSADGTPLLAFLERDPEEWGWRVVVAPLRADDGAAGAPAIRRAEARVLAEGRGTLAPGISADGRWVASLAAGASTAPATVERLPLAPAPTLALGAGPTP